jgi:hypothetical protein
VETQLQSLNEGTAAPLPPDRVHALALALAAWLSGHTPTPYPTAGGADVHVSSSMITPREAVTETGVAMWLESVFAKAQPDASFAAAAAAAAADLCAQRRRASALAPYALGWLPLLTHTTLVGVCARVLMCVGLCACVLVSVCVSVCPSLCRSLALSLCVCLCGWVLGTGRRPGRLRRCRHRSPRVLPISPNGPQGRP